MTLQKQIFDQYLDIRSDNLDNFSDAAEQERFRQIVKHNYQKWLKKQGRMLEIGCYKGYTLNELKKFTDPNSVYALELCDSLVAYAKKYTGLENIFCADAFAYLPENRNAFDNIILKAVLEHIAKDRIGEFLSLINAALKPDGIALVSVPNMDWIMASHERYMDFTHEVGFTKESLYDVMKVYFAEVQVMPMSYDFPDGLKGRFRKKFVTPVVRSLVGKVYALLGEGAYTDTMFNRSLLAIGRKK